MNEIYASRINVMGGIDRDFRTPDFLCSALTADHFNFRYFDTPCLRQRPETGVELLVIVSGYPLKRRFGQGFAVSLTDIKDVPRKEIHNLLRFAVVLFDFLETRAQYHDTLFAFFHVPAYFLPSPISSIITAPDQTI